MSNRTVTRVAVKGVKNCSKDSRSEVYILQVSWSDNTNYVIYRSFADIFNVHVKLLKDFPVEAGKVKTNERVLPELSRCDAKGSQPQIMANIAVYFERLLGLEQKVIRHSGLTSLLSLTPADLDAAKDVGSRTNKSTEKSSRNAETAASKEPSEISSISGPLPTETYEAVASYKSKGKSEVNLKAGDLVDVVDKNPNGWWLVRVDDQEGWAPSTYLQSLYADSYSIEETPCLSGEIFLTTKPYTAQQEDELSFPTNATIEVLSKIKDGWWIASYNCKVGYVPAAFLVLYNDPHLETGVRTATSARPEAPVERRNTIKGIKTEAQRDLTIYRKASEKNRAARAVTIAEATALATTLDNVLSAELRSTAASSGPGEDSMSDRSAAVATSPTGHEESRAPAITDVDNKKSAENAEPGISTHLVVRRKETGKSRSPAVSRDAQFFINVDEQLKATGILHADKQQE